MLRERMLPDHPSPWLAGDHRQSDCHAVDQEKMREVIEKSDAPKGPHHAAAGIAVEQRERDQYWPECHEEKLQGRRVLFHVDERDDRFGDCWLLGEDPSIARYRVAVDIAYAEDDEQQNGEPAKRRQQLPSPFLR